MQPHAQTAPDHAPPEGERPGGALPEPALTEPALFEPAGGSVRAWVVFLLTVFVGLIADLASKRIAFEAIAGAPVVVTRADVEAAGPHALQSLIPPHPPVTVVPHVLDLHLVLNSGAVFGAGQGLRWFFIAFTGAALAFAIVLFARWSPRRDWASHIGIGLIVCGGLGNLYDRLTFAAVRDFLHPLPTAQLPFGLRWPGGDTALWPYVSNVADAFLIVGIGMLMIRLWRQPKAARPLQPNAG